MALQLPGLIMPRVLSLSVSYDSFIFPDKIACLTGLHNVAIIKILKSHFIKSFQDTFGLAHSFQNASILTIHAVYF